MGENDSLQYVPMEKWSELENAFEKQGPLGITGYSVLRTQKELHQKGLDYGFKVYCPYGEPSAGLVAFNRKGKCNEIVVQCPKEDTSSLEKALVTTKLIDWTTPILIPCVPDHTFECIRRVAAKVNTNIGTQHTLYDVVLFGREMPQFEDVRLPDGVTFDFISEKYIDQIDRAWVNRFDGSTWFFQLYVKAKTAYGLFKNDELLSCVFISETGMLLHMYTFENHRKKGYAKMLLKHVCNLQLKENKYVYAFCMKGNESALQLYKTLNFKVFHCIKWCYMRPK